MERRTYATFKMQWPVESAVMVTSPAILYENYFNEDQPKDAIIHIMVGDLQRIIDYPKLGFQISQDVPDEVLTAYCRLIELGYNQHLVTV